jgi:hypothetical protein
MNNVPKNVCRRKQRKNQQLGNHSKKQQGVRNPGKFVAIDVALPTEPSTKVL